MLLCNYQSLSRAVQPTAFRIFTYILLYLAVKVIALHLKFIQYFNFQMFGMPLIYQNLTMQIIIWKLMIFENLLCSALSKSDFLLVNYISIIKIYSHRQLLQFLSTIIYSFLQVSNKSSARIF